jgi:hypothetical protein
MVKAEILTDGGQYYVNIPPSELSGAKEALAYVQKTINNGDAFAGIDGDLLLVCGNLKHIRIFKDDVKPAQQETPQPATKNPGVWYQFVLRYLDQPLVVQAVTMDYDVFGEVTTYFVPMTANKQPLEDIVDQHKLRRLLIDQLAVTYPGETEVLVPPAPLPDEAAALEYIQDYIKETQTTRLAGGPKNAGAYHGLGGKE